MLDRGLTRRSALRAGTLLASGGILAAGLLDEPSIAAAVKTKSATPRAIVRNADLTAQAHYLLPVGSIRPTGWLQSQIRLQAEGLCGNMDIVSDYDEVGAGTQWTGASPGRDIRAERTPYWLDGLVPLAYMIDDPVLAGRMRKKVRRWLAWTLAEDGNIRKAVQRDYDPDATSDGYFGRGWWPAMPMLKAMSQYYEVTEDPVVLQRIYAFFNDQLDELDRTPFTGWASFRWQDNVLALFWLYNRIDDQARRKRLLDLANRLRIPGKGFTGPLLEGVGSFDWVAKFADVGDMKEPTPKVGFSMWKHGVNVGQALKTGAVLSLYPDETNPAGKRALIADWLAMLDKYHGLPNGMFSCVEHLGGRNPSSGSETCAIAETLYSLEYALAVGGDAALGDRAEKIAYNCLAAALDPQLRDRQYISQCNQVSAMGGGPWNTDHGPWVNVFSLAGALGCCTANHAQAWPKFVSSLWMAEVAADGREGLVAALYGPSNVSILLNREPVTLEQDTAYPFRKSVTIRVKDLGNRKSARFPLKLRIPEWSGRSTLAAVNGAPQVVKEPWLLIDRDWKVGDTVTLHFRGSPQAKLAEDGKTVSFEDGPLVFARDIPSKAIVRNADPNASGGHEWDVSKNPDEANFTPRYSRTLDYSLLNHDLACDEPHRSTWAYAADSRADQAIVRREGPMPGPVPFASVSPPVTLRVHSYQITATSWPMVKSTEPHLTSSPWPDAWYATPPPNLSADDVRADRRITLIPYGAARLRLTVFPTVDDS